MTEAEIKKLSDSELLGMVLEATRDGNVGAFLKEIKVKDGKVLNEIDVNTRATDRCTPTFYITKDHLFLNLAFSYEKDMDMMALKAQFNEYLKKSTNAITKNNSSVGSDFVLLYEVISVKGDITYQMTCVNPIFMYQEDKVLKMVFGADSIGFSARAVDYSDVDSELDYEMKVRAEEEEKEYQKQLDEESDTSEDSDN